MAHKSEAPRIAQKVNVLNTLATLDAAVLDKTSTLNTVQLKAFLTQVNLSISSYAPDPFVNVVVPERDFSSRFDAILDGAGVATSGALPLPPCTEPEEAAPVGGQPSTQGLAEAGGLAPNSPVVGELSGAALQARAAIDTQPNRLLAANDDQLGYWDRYIQHVETYAITPPPVVTTALLGGGAMPKVWVPWTGGRLAGSPNPLTSVPRGLLGSGPITTAPLMRQVVFPALAVGGAFVGGYNVGVLLSGFVYAAFSGSNALPSPPPSASKGPGP